MRARVIRRYNEGSIEPILRWLLENNIEIIVEHWPSTKPRTMNVLAMLAWIDPQFEGRFFGDIEIDFPDSGTAAQFLLRFT